MKADALLVPRRGVSWLAPQKFSLGKHFAFGFFGHRFLDLKYFVLYFRHDTFSNSRTIVAILIFHEHRAEGRAYLFNGTSHPTPRTLRSTSIDSATSSFLQTREMLAELNPRYVTTCPSSVSSKYPHPLWASGEAREMRDEVSDCYLWGIALLL